MTDNLLRFFVYHAYAAPRPIEVTLVSTRPGYCPTFTFPGHTATFKAYKSGRVTRHGTTKLQGKVFEDYADAVDYADDVTWRKFTERTSGQLYMPPNITREVIIEWENLIMGNCK
jgi:hypothetical protein